MFKGRIEVWALIIGVCIILQSAFTIVPSWLESYDVTVNVDVEKDENLEQMLSERQIGDFEFHLTDSNPDISIKANGTGSSVVKNSDIYSPLVLYATNVYYDDDGFIKVSNESNCYKIDLYSVLEGMEKGITWKELGFHKDTINGDVKLYIPNENCAYYNDVVDLFYLTLNGGKMPDEETRTALEPRVAAILEKCVKVVDIGQAILDEAHDETKNHKVFIAPEYLYTRGTDRYGSMASESSKYFRPVYFKNTIYLTADIFVNKSKEDSKELTEKLMEELKKEDNFVYKTGWRVKDIEYDINYEVSGTFLQNP